MRFRLDVRNMGRLETGRLEARSDEDSALLRRIRKYVSYTTREMSAGKLS